MAFRNILVWISFNSKACFVTQIIELTTSNQSFMSKDNNIQ
jgi:hypothetical protein